MEKIITTIVTQLLSKLAKDRLFYTQKDLSDYGFPPFLIKRIIFHLFRELSNEFKLPGEEWVNGGSDELQAEWAELQRTIKREIHLPAHLVKQIVEKSVRECIGMTIQPRKVIPELLFEESSELDSNQVTERSSAITVNRFLVWSMVRYMEKKNRKSLSISDATRIIESIENKIVESYHPLNWLSLVKPLYELSGNTVHSDYFRRFFEHKGKNHLAKEFDLIDDEIKESRFIEILSSPRSIHVEGYKEDQQNLFQDGIEGVNVGTVVPNKDLIKKQDEGIESKSDVKPIFQSFTEDLVEEPAEWVEDHEEENVTDLSEDLEKEQEADLSVSLEKEQEADLSEDLEKEQEADLKEEEFSENVPLDEEIKAPWEEVEEGSFSFRTNKDLQGSSDSKFKDQGEAAQEALSEEKVADGINIEKSESFKKEMPASDARLLEIEDDEEALYNRFKSTEDQDESIPESDEDEIEETESMEETASESPDIDSESDVAMDKEALYNRFKFDDSDKEDTLGGMESDGDKKATTIYDELNLVRNNAEPETMDLFGLFKTPEMEENPTLLNTETEGSDPGDEESESIRPFSATDESVNESDSDETEVPMWRSFLERDEKDVKSAFQFDDNTEFNEEEPEDEDSDEILDEDGFIEKPIYDFTQKEPDLDEKIGDLSNWMMDVREKFIEDLFGDSEDAYELALADIMEFEDWKNASKYIEKEIFTRNRIDIYDEIAVDFTDRLHSYFIENKS